MITPTTRRPRLLRATGPLLALVGLLSGGPAAQESPDEPQLVTPLARSEDLSRSGLAFVALEAPRPAYVVGEPFELRLRFGFERAFLAQGLVQLFQRPLDVPAQVSAPALEGLQGLRFDQPLAEEASGQGASFALGERIVRARALPDELRDGRAFAVFELTRRARALHPGALELGAPVLAFAHATRFEESFLHGRVPLDRSDAFVRGELARLTILPPPEESRPPGFTGAVGRCRLTASAMPQDLLLGESLTLEVRLESDEEGVLLPGHEPRLEHLAGFHVRGQLVEAEPRGLRARYELVPEAEGVFELPAVTFVYYEPLPPAGYRTLASEPIPLVVRAPAPAGGGSRATPVAEPNAPGLLGPLELVLVLVLFAVLLAVQLARRSRRG